MFEEKKKKKEEIFLNFILLCESVIGIVLLSACTMYRLSSDNVVLKHFSIVKFI